MNEDWSQPDFYHFNQDSLTLVNWIQEQKIQATSILDFGCGCGIIGIELARRLQPLKLTLVELQAEFIPHIEANLRDFHPPSVAVHIENESFQNFHSMEKFDLIVSNPPFYLPEHGKQSENLKRARCRSFVVDGWEVFLNQAKVHLKSMGRILVIIPQDRVLHDHVASLVLNSGLFLKYYEVGKMPILELTAA